MKRILLLTLLAFWPCVCFASTAEYIDLLKKSTLKLIDEVNGLKQSQKHFTASLERVLKRIELLEKKSTGQSCDYNKCKKIAALWKIERRLSSFIEVELEKYLIFVGAYKGISQAQSYQNALHEKVGRRPILLLPHSNQYYRLCYDFSSMKEAKAFLSKLQKLGIDGYIIKKTINPNMLIDRDSAFSKLAADFNKKEALQLDDIMTGNFYTVERAVAKWGLIIMKVKGPLLFIKSFPWYQKIDDNYWLVGF